MRGITYFRIFSKTRYMINLLIEIFKDIRSFVILLFYTTFAFSIMFYANEENSDLKFGDYLSSSYTINLGAFETDNYDSLQWLIFCLATLVNPIIMLNLLIAILGDTFSNVQDNMIVADKKELAEVILDIESLMYWRRKFNLKSFIQICSEEESEKMDTWNGKTRELKERLLDMKEAISSSGVKMIDTVTTLCDSFEKLDNAYRGKVKDDSIGVAKKELTEEEKKAKEEEDEKKKNIKQQKIDKAKASADEYKKREENVSNQLATLKSLIENLEKA